MTAVLPSPSDHLEMPKRMAGRRVVRTCSCGKPWPCDQSRWQLLKEALTSARDSHQELIDASVDPAPHMTMVTAYQYALNKMQDLETDQ